MDNLLKAIWDANDQHISCKGYRAFPINDRYVILYASPDDPGHTMVSGVRLDITYVDTHSDLAAAAATIQREIAKDGR